MAKAKTTPKKNVTSKAKTTVISSKKKGMSSLKKAYFISLSAVVVIVLAFTGFSLFGNFSANAGTSDKQQVQAAANTVHRKEALVATAQTKFNKAQQAFDAANKAYAPFEKKVEAAQANLDTATTPASVKKLNDASAAAIKAAKPTKDALTKATKTLADKQAELTGATGSLVEAKTNYETIVAKQAADALAAKDRISKGNPPSNVKITNTKKGKITVAFTGPTNISANQYRINIYTKTPATGATSATDGLVGKEIVIKPSQVPKSIDIAKGNYYMTIQSFNLFNGDYLPAGITDYIPFTVTK